MLSSPLSTSLRFNREVTIDSTVTLAGEFIKKFAEQYPLRGLVNKNKEIIGLSGSFFTRSFKKVSLTAKIPTVGEGFSLVNMRFLKFSQDGCLRSWEFKAEKEIMKDFGENPVVVKSPQELLYVLLEEVRKHVELKILYGMNSRGFKTVYGVSFDGLYSAKEFHQTMMNSIVGHMKAILFPRKNPETGIGE